MADPLALYASVMGRLWEDERIRGQAAARIDARLAGRRQGRSFSRVGSMSARNALKVASGQSRAAVFKRIRAGGCKTRCSLGAQISYINDKAVYTYSTMTNALTDAAVLSEEQKEDIIEDWAGTWRGSTKLGFTSHMLLSFPTDVTVDQVCDIAMDWTEHFFESGEYGDQWDYVLAVHDDRAHKHAHIILNNRGVENGTWFSCWAEGVMSPQLMREKQAEIAEGYGVTLDATTRLERGIFEKPAGIEEIYRAKEEARLPREIVMTAQESAMAQAQVVGFAKDYKYLADLLDRMDQRHMARAVRGMADGLGSGTPWNFTEGEIDMKDIKTVGDAIDYSERTIEALRLKAEELDPAERAAFEAKAAPIIADLSQMVPDPELRARFGKQLEEPYPPGAGSEVLIAALQSGNDEGLRYVLERAEEVGMDSEELVARITAGGTRNYGMAQDWVERDMNAVLAKDGLSVETASDDQLDAALEKVDGVMDALMERAKELGVEIGRTLADEEEATLPLIDEDDRTPNPYLQDLADMLRDGKLTEEQEEVVERTLQSELFKELGEEGLAALRRGNYEVLDAALPSKLDQITVTQEFLEMTFEETGDQVFTDRAAGLQQDKATEVARMRGQQEAQEMGRELARNKTLDRGLDDEMEF
ncbi:relaxase/mobilization nuclease domain-containing protein [Phaeobacter gallaeciensis]|jgi:type IV secretion system T-DNA border endonuclease VirD2|uniref:Relaxase/Mobilisation nuclease domain-containing protein n=1 Tax=Primorskyibacter flagellatus TaxID=1387277 RepID=A0A1W2DK87_9RHOB|nr:MULTISPECIES: relaxase/mobilization nuclease domain-containing protein [Roseobacteraceae]KZY34913.1 endonuclease [Roseovarius sp. HI0049]MCZ4368666.1 relaxase/mobilization nuclease domain-containing protein [Sulfitobacter dubius]MDD9722759.1 relaxase/mobilization nuclease domain-containing protein [Sulfitobacter sp. PR48]MDE4175371.1 relaxase/mobilization nuclease domain-containing protein [Phaeobacter sp. PT47_59]MDE4306049.1 relaxase/mobilization nuclease domain-containing protein [Phaeob